LEALLAEWQCALADEGVQAIAVLGPQPDGAVAQRRVLAVHPLDAQQAAQALSRSPDFGEGPHPQGAPPVAWQLLARPLRLPEAESDAQWRRAWRARGLQTVVRVSFGLPAERRIDCFLFTAEGLQRRGQAALLGWLVQSWWPALRAALVTVWCPLTRRELQCLRLAFDGMTARASAERMACTERTVNFHLSNAMAKLGVDSKMAAIQRACWLGAI
jgi:DNA-binding CsgD family transcriptional regulator